ncbi:MAG: GNAT family N-acetyltransferase [Actinomycetota bacterium]
MEPVLRPARPEDKPAIAAFTQGTFPWGDYVERAFDRWLAGPDSLTVVAEVAGEVVGVARGALLSPAEAWSQGLRVHPDHRRRHLGAALLEHLAVWAASAGARVMRLSAEEWNESALALFSTLGFRPVGAWLAAERPVELGKPSPGGNGGKRVPAPERLTPAPPAEAAAAMLAWAGGPLEQAAHGLFATHWSWRRLTLGDLETAARRRVLWQARSGWAVAESDEGSFHVAWLGTFAEEAGILLRALVDLAAAAGAERLEMEVPAVDWLRSALEQSGFQLHPLQVCARAL